MKKSNLVKRINTAAIELKNDERGLTTVEYVILLAVVCVAAIGLWRAFGTAVTDKVTAQGTEITNM